ncbi:MAG: hypothetical protein ABJE47_06220 [bacterium]
MISLIAAGALAACSHDAAPGSCWGDGFAPGVVTFVPAIDILVRDAKGTSQALGTKVTVYRGADSTVAFGHDTLLVAAGYAEAGSFTVRVSRPFYRDTLIPSVTVLAGQCSAIATKVPVTLQLEPGAPAIRALAIFGGGFLVTPGDQRQLLARFDADASVPTTVSWRLSDTTLARIDAGGFVTSKCTTVGGTERVTAVATTDTSVKATTEFGVAKQTGCQ